MKKKVDIVNVVLAIAVIFLIVAVILFLADMGFDDTPYARGPYGSDVVRPKSPYKPWKWVFAALSCVTCFCPTIVWGMQYEKKYEKKEKAKKEK